MADDLEQGGEESEGEGSATVAARAEAALDSALDEHFADMDAEEAEEGQESPERPAGKRSEREARARAEIDDDQEDDDEDLPEPSEDDEDEDGGLEGDEEDEDDEGDEAEPDEDDLELELHRAYTTLHDKLQVPASVLKSTPRAKLIAWAKRVEEGAAEAAARDSGGSSSERDSTAGAKGDADGSKGAEKSAQTWAAMRAGIAEKLGIDEESADGMKPLFDSNEALRGEVATLNANLAALKASIAEERQATAVREGQKVIDANVRRLEKRYPSLRHKKNVDALVQKAHSLITSGHTDDARVAFDDAAGLLRKQLGRPRRSDLSSLRRNGLSSAPDRRGDRSGIGAELTEADFWNRAADYAMNGRKDAISKLRLPAAAKKVRTR